MDYLGFKTKDKRYSERTSILIQDIWKNLGMHKSGILYQAWFHQKVNIPLMNGGKTFRQKFHAARKVHDYLMDNGPEGLMLQMNEVAEGLSKEERLEEHYHHLAREDKRRGGKPAYPTIWSKERRHEARADRPFVLAYRPRTPVDKILKDHRDYQERH